MLILRSLIVAVATPSPMKGSLEVGNYSSVPIQFSEHLSLKRLAIDQAMSEQSYNYIQPV